MTNQARGAGQNRRSTSQKQRSNLVRIAQLMLASDMARKLGKRSLARKLDAMVKARVMR